MHLITNHDPGRVANEFTECESGAVCVAVEQGSVSSPHRLPQNHTL